MGLIVRILKSPAKYRRTRGFGVHSPFAFHFITRVIREHKASYYAYSQLPRGRKAHRSRMKLLVRVLAHFHPSHIMEVGRGNEVTRLILQSAAPKATLTQWTDNNPAPLAADPDFVLIHPMATRPSPTLHLHLIDMTREGECVIFFRNLHSDPFMRQLWDAVAASAPHGMGFTNGKTGIFVAHRHLPYRIYKIFM